MIVQPQETDLRSITRHADRMSCKVTVFDVADESRFTWLLLGECQIRRIDRDTGRHRLEAHLRDHACDEEHDTAYALRLPLIGLSLADLGVHDSTVHFVAWVDPNAADDHDPAGPDFHVPLPGYNPMAHPKATECAGIHDKRRRLYCKWGDGKKHIIVPSGFYVPPFDAALYKAVRGRRVDIAIGPVLPEEGTS